MNREILYYTPKYGIKNKAGNATLTFGWYKKHFRLKELKYFNQIPYAEVGDDFDPPLLGWNVSYNISAPENNIVLEGVVESIIQQKTDDVEIYHVLINPYKK